MTKRVVTSKTTTYVTSKANQDEADISGIWLQEEDFEKRPKTDYTYARSATYSNKYVSGQVISPNLSRRKLYTGQIIRDNQSSSELRPESPVLSHVRTYGSRTTRGSNVSSSSVSNLANDNLSGSRHHSVESGMLTRSGQKSAAGNSTVTSTTTTTTTTTQRNSNNNNAESIFSSDEEYTTSTSSTAMRGRGGRGRGRGGSANRSRSRSRTRNARSGRAAVVTDSDSNLSVSKTAASKSYTLTSGLDDSVTTETGTPGITDKIGNLLNGLYLWREQQSYKQPIVEGSSSAGHGVDWNTVIDARIAELKSSLLLHHNKMASEHMQQKTEFETSLRSLQRDVETMKLTLSTLDQISNDLQALKLTVSQHSEQLTLRNGYRESIVKLQSDIQALRAKLGEVDLGTESEKDSGILIYLYNELNNLKTSLDRERAREVPLPCPDSNCVCETDLGLRLTALYDKLMEEMKHGGTTVILNSDNSTGLSEQLVKKMIQDELDIFAADQTGMVDFALQSVGGQVISTRCSQTYSQYSPILRLFGLPLYYMEKDPSIVIQPGVVPGECWCFHGSSGSLVITMAADIKFNSFSLEHISPKQSSTGEILSAPKDVEVYGLKTEMDTEGKRVGRWRYEKTGPRLQFFPVHDGAIPAYRIIEVRVLTNWGQPEHTCLYRFRVHGKLDSS